MLQSYLGEEHAEMYPELGRDSRGNMTSSGKDQSRRHVTVAGWEVADMSFPDHPFSMCFMSVVREHERAVIFRLGHLLRGRPRGPGLLFYLPVLDVCHKVDVRLTMLKVPLHTVVTKDLVRPELSAVCYYQIENVALCSAALCSLTTMLQSLLQAVIRDILAQHTFSHILLHRRKIGQKIQAGADSVACRWGIRVERADIKQTRFGQCPSLDNEGQQLFKCNAFISGKGTNLSGLVTKAALVNDVLFLCPLPV
uniref:Podocin n=1 Tax=Mola mola TaxID=94237 RepID=A0A3Q3W068_MOLML